MLAMTSVIVDYMFNNAFLTFYILQAPPKRREAHGNLPLYSPSRREQVFNNAFNKLTLLQL